MRNLRVWLAVSPWLLAAAGLCVPAQLLYGWARSPAGGGQVHLYTRPSGAAVRLVVPDVGSLTSHARALPPKPVGTTPGPLHLGYRDIPCTVYLTLPGYEDQALYLPAGTFAPGRDRYPERGFVELVPRIPILSSLPYLARDAPFVLLATLLLAAWGARLRAWSATMRAERRLRLNLELGDLSPGVLVGSYRLGKVLGVGGMARVFEATREGEARGEVVALKALSTRLSSDPEFRRRFEREVNICRTLHHPHIAHLLDWGEASRFLYIVMEKVEGQTLAERAGARPLTVRESVAVARQIAEALRYAHEQGVIHRDVKPANVMVRPDGSAVLMDFGIARRADLPVVTEAGQGLGTPAYVAPEQVRGLDLDWRADHYALGLVLYEMLAGRHPYEGATHVELMARHAEAEPPLLHTVCPQAPPALEALVHRMLSKDPRMRAEATDEVVRTLRAVEEGL